VLGACWASAVYDYVAQQGETVTAILASAPELLLIDGTVISKFVAAVENAGLAEATLQVTQLIFLAHAAVQRAVAECENFGTFQAELGLAMEEVK